MKRSILFPFVTLLAVSLTACGLVAAPENIPTPTTEINLVVMVPSSTPDAAAAVLPTITPLPTIAALPTPITPMSALAGVEGLVLREGPGRLFDIRNTYAQDTEFTVLGQAPGGEWYFVIMSNSLSGWMFSEFVTLQGDPANLPYIAVLDVDVVSGRVTTPDGTPAEDIGISLAPANIDLSAGQDATKTDSSGVYYFYIPVGTIGNFAIGPNSYGCEGNLTNVHCELPYKLPGAVLFMLPDDAGMTFDFVLIPR